MKVKGNLSFLFWQLEDEIKGLSRKVTLLEDDLERANERGEQATSKLEEASKAADESER